MRIHWKGRLSDVNSFPKLKVPSNSNILLDDKISLLDYAPIIGILIILYFVNKIKRSVYPGLRIELLGFFIGTGIAILFIPIHELMHCLFCPKDTDINVYYSIYGITSYPLDALSKWRYIVMAMAPAVFMGFIPMVMWIFIPAKYVLINSIIIIFSVINLSTMTVDIKNAILAMIKVPSNAYIQASGNKVYWFEALKYAKRRR